MAAFIKKKTRKPGLNLAARKKGGEPSPVPALVKKQEFSNCFLSKSKNSQTVFIQKEEKKSLLHVQARKLMPSSMKNVGKPIPVPILNEKARIFKTCFHQKARKNLLYSMSKQENSCLVP